MKRYTVMSDAEKTPGTGAWVYVCVLERCGDVTLSDNAEMRCTVRYHLKISKDKFYPNVAMQTIWSYFTSQFMENWVSLMRNDWDHIEIFQNVFICVFLIWTHTYTFDSLHWSLAFATHWQSWHNALRWLKLSWRLRAKHLPAESFHVSSSPSQFCSFLQACTHHVTPLQKSIGAHCVFWIWRVARASTAPPYTVT